MRWRASSMTSTKRTDFFVIVRATMTISQAARRRRSFQADRIRRPAAAVDTSGLAIGREASVRGRPAGGGLADGLSTVYLTPRSARKESAVDIGLPETEQEIEITPLEEPVPEPAPVERPVEEPVPA